AVAAFVGNGTAILDTVSLSSSSSGGNCYGLSLSDIVLTANNLRIAATTSGGGQVRGIDSLANAGPTFNISNSTITASSTSTGNIRGISLTNVSGTISGSVITASTTGDRKSTRLNSSHVAISYAVFCLKKKNKTTD